MLTFNYKPQIQNLPKPQNFNSPNDRVNPPQTFAALFRTNKHWLTTCSKKEVMSWLYSSFKNYFTNTMKINYNKLHIDIRSISTAKQLKDKDKNQCVKLFKELYRMPYRCEDGFSQVATLKKIVQKSGKVIIGHGIEESKGGLVNLLLMMVNGHVLTDTSNWGPLTNASSEISALNHGPYFLIYSIRGEYPSCQKIDLKKIEYIILPFEENIEMVKEQINKIKSKSLVDTTMADSIVKKLRSYQSLLDELQNKNLNSDVSQSYISQSDLDDGNKAQPNLCKSRSARRKINFG